MFDNTKIIDKQAFFIYEKADGSIEGYHVVNVSISDHHLQGVALPQKQFRTFRIDRIVTMFEEKGELLNADVPSLMAASPTRPLKKALSHHTEKAEIAFTGFSKVVRDRLEKQAEDAGLTIKKDVTKRLAYLCCGPNAGPTKTAKARDNGVLALTEQQFMALITTGELPEVGEYDLMMGTPSTEASNDIDYIRDTFTTWRTLPRRQCLIARFVDGYAAGWRFCVHEAHRPALDIKQTVISTSNPDRPQAKISKSVWTQGHAFNFIGGELICSHVSGHRGPWSEFVKMTNERVLSVKFSTPAGYDTVDRIEGEFTGVLRRNNASSAQGERSQDRIPLAINSQAYDEGTVTLAVSQPDGEHLVEIERITLTQVEFVALLQNGSFTRTTTLLDGSYSIETYSPFERHSILELAPQLETI
jgi:hypothetical protein